MEGHRYHAILPVLTAWLVFFGQPAMANDVIDFQVVHPQFRAIAAGPSYRAIRTRAEFDAALKSLAPTTPAPTAPAPIIDFDRYTLLMADAGVKPSGGYSIIFNSVRDVHREAAPTITVFLLDLGPGSCTRTEALTHPIAFALVPKTTEPIRFIVAKADSNCSSQPDSANEVS